MKVVLHLIDLSDVDDACKHELNDTFVNSLEAFQTHEFHEAKHYLVGRDVKAAMNVKERIIKEILAFVKPQDRMMALASVLLKSMAFTNLLQLEFRQPRTVAILPRTKYRKPFIPMNLIAGTDDEIPQTSISLSHQWSFVGLCQIDHGLVFGQAVEENARQVKSLPHCKVGFDIVVFEPPNPRLYSSVREFAEVFQESFDRVEWQSIENANPSEHMLRELYVRWAVKEAYTKALGLGLSQFNSFQLEWCDIKETSLWRHISEREEDGTLDIRAKVTHFSDMECPSEWLFNFTRLWDNDKVKGMGCVCIGPTDNETRVIAQEIRKTSIADLMGG